MAPRRSSSRRSTPKPVPVADLSDVSSASSRSEHEDRPVKSRNQKSKVDVSAAESASNITTAMSSDSGTDQSDVVSSKNNASRRGPSRHARKPAKNTGSHRAKASTGKGTSSRRRPKSTTKGKRSKQSTGSRRRVVRKSK